VKELADMIRAARHVVVYTGAGVSTSTSLPDYRGPNGVWTLAAQGLKPHFTKSLEEIHPTVSKIRDLCFFLRLAKHRFVT